MASQLFLAGTVSVFIVVSAKYFSNNQDAIEYKYLFKNIALNHALLLPGNHPNIVKFPIFYLDSLLPSTYGVYLFFSALMVIGCIYGWLYLSHRAFCRDYRYTSIMSVILGCFLLFSQTMLSNLTETTIRNIEYPISLLFVFVMYRIFLSGRTHTNRTYWLASCVGALFAVTVAGDTLLLTSVMIPLMMTLAILAIARPEYRRRATWLAAGYIVVVSIAAYVVRALVHSVGLADYYYDTMFTPTLHSAKLLIYGCIYSFNQSLGLMGFSDSRFMIAGDLIAVSVLGMALYGGYRVWKNHKKIPPFDFFVIIWALLAAAITLASYAASGFATAIQPNGTTASSGNMRYITFVPLLLALAAIGSLRLFVRPPRALRAHAPAVAMAIITIILISIPIGFDNYVGTYTHAKALNVYYDHVISVLKSHNVTRFVTGDTSGAVIRLRSHDTLTYANIGSCSEMMDHNTRRDWFKPTPETSEAVIVDTTGPDAGYWTSCAINHISIQSIYGTPTTTVTLDNTAGKTTIYFYNHDVFVRIHQH